MFRRFFRWFSVALLALCIVAWLGSYRRWGVSVGYESKLGPLGREIWHGGMDRGRIYYFDAMDSWGAGRTEGWFAGFKDNYGLGWENFDADANFSCVGFTFGHHDYVVITIPLWFPTALSAVLVYFLWRKPRRKGGGFPVEAKQNADR